MANEDISKLKIDKAAATFKTAQRKMSPYLIAAAIGSIVLIALFLSGVFTPAAEVKVATVSQTYPHQAFTVLNASGYVVAQRRAAVASKVTGRLVWLGVEEGSRVRKGEIIARLENEDVSATRSQAAANLNVARSNLDQAKAELRDAAVVYNREKELLEREFTTKASYDAALARYQMAQAAVEGAEATIRANTAALRGADVAVEYTFIRAPFDAVVLTKNADVGDIVTPIGAAAEAKAAVVTIADMDSLQVEADVSESNIQKVRVGQPCEIQLDALPDVRFSGEVHMIVPTADRTKATVLAKIRFIDKDKRILPEMSAKVAFLSRPVAPEEERPRTTVNPAAVVSRNGKKAVFVVKDDRVILTTITTGAQLGDVVEVQSGVKAGDRVVLNPPERLKSGAKIKVAEK
ncbi:MAG: efflux RND transporter periplasmic adaptor subunit [Nitrospirota bacterium]